VYNFRQFRGNEDAVTALSVQTKLSVGNIVLGKLYFTRQAASLLKFAKATSNPELAAVLVQKAADLKAEIEHPRTAEDKSPVAPDVE
jgi:hypothetical protein